MKKLRTTRKITMATLKSFAKRNAGNLYCKTLSDFDGMVGMVEDVKDEFSKTKVDLNDSGYYNTGIQGIYTVGRGGDYCSEFEDDTFYGIKVYNACGSSILAVKKADVKESTVIAVNPDADSELTIVKHKSVYALLGDSRVFSDQLGRNGLKLRFNRGLNRPEGKEAGWVLFAEQVDEVAQITGAQIITENN